METGIAANSDDCAFALMKVMQEACIRSQNYGHKNIELPLTFMGHHVEVTFKKIKTVEITERSLVDAFTAAFKTVNVKNVSAADYSAIFKEMKKELGL